MNDLEKIKKELEEVKAIEENKSEIISVTAHQLRTYLSALKWILKMFLNKDFGEINDEQKDHLEKAINSNERAIALVNYLLTFNHAENIFNTLNFKKIDIIKIIDDVAAIFYGELKNKNIQLKINKNNIEKTEIECDKEMISVIFQNLVENAIKYSFENSEISIDINKNEDTNEVIISVHNNGINIKKDDQAKIFNKFYRAPNAIQKENIGSGLGLFTSKVITEKHGGKIWFESGDESGTTFFVSLPLILNNMI